MSDEKFTDDNGWDEYKKLILSELGRIADYTKESRELMDKYCKATSAETTQSNKEMTSLVNALELRILTKLSPIQQEIATLKVKAGVWGLGGGIVAALTILAMWLVQQASAAP